MSNYLNLIELDDGKDSYHIYAIKWGSDTYEIHRVVKWKAKVDEPEDDKDYDVCDITQAAIPTRVLDKFEEKLFRRDGD
jgi:hypothetical protein